MKWRKWLKGLASAAIGGAVNGVPAAVIAPESFNLQEWQGVGKLGIMVLVGASLAVANYLKKSPLPEEKEPTS